MNELRLATPPKSYRASFDAGEGEVTDIELLHSISLELIGEHDSAGLYGKIVDAAIAITGSQFGTMQQLYTSDEDADRRGYLQMLCSRGLSPEGEAFWKWVSPAALSSCALALRTGRRGVISDYEQWDEIAGTPELVAFREAGIRAAQTTPLLSRGGELLGMISTHWSEPHQPSERDLRMLDILARQAADLLERTIAEEALRKREEMQKMLTGELSHRVKNMLAMVQAIASQTLRNSEDPADFVDSFTGRIQSMSRVHSQLSTNEWKGTRLRDIVRDQMKLGPVDEAQISASGPDIHLDAVAVPKMAMILHELGTNSLKYGALSKPDGAVKIDWTVSGHRLEMGWSERGGPVIGAPVRRGFGTRLIEASVRGDGGDAVMTTSADGVRWDIVFPLVATQPSADMAIEPLIAEMQASDPTGVVPAVRPGSELAGKRVLVIEDEPLLAIDLTGQIEDAGAHVVGPAGSVHAALGLIEQYRFDAALLDANLDGQAVDEVAAALTAKSIPFVFVSGYGRASLPQGFDDAELLSKPFNTGQLLDALAKLVHA